MKHQIEKPSEQGMRFFTPELFVAFNSPDEDEAALADEAWEEALRKYRSHLASIRKRLPVEARKLSKISLHDAGILVCAEPQEPFVKLSDFPFPQWLHVAILSLSRDEEVVTLLYALDGRVRKHRSHESWPFSKEAVHWLYDELDVTSDVEARFVHRILLSDGIVLEIPFTSMLIQQSPLSSGMAENQSKQIA